jgi:hypothetical protein
MCHRSYTNIKPKKKSPNKKRQKKMARERNWPLTAVVGLEPTSYHRRELAQPR